MALIWKSHGTVGPGSLGGCHSMPLDVIDKHLKDFRVFNHGERPKTVLPQRREHYTHIMIEVTDDDPEPRPDRFPRPGFYQVVGLRPPAERRGVIVCLKRSTVTRYFLLRRYPRTIASVPPRSVRALRA
jgi:hypothetical protein